MALEALRILIEYNINSPEVCLPNKQGDGFCLQTHLTYTL